MALKVALYQPWIYQRGGMEQVILEMTSKSSRHDWTIFTSHYSPQTTFPEFAGRNVVELERVSVKRSPIYLAKAAATISSQKIDLSGFDVLLVSSAGFGEFITLRNHSLPTALFCHTPLRVIHDPAVRAEFISRNKAFLPAFLAFEAAYKLLEKRAWKNFSTVCCNSEETAQRIGRAGLFPRQKLSVFRPGVHTKLLRPSWKYGNYLLAPGRISKLKNNLLAVEAYKLYRQMGKGTLRLVLAGGVGEKDRGYLKELEQEAAGVPGVSIETNVSRQRLQALYRGAYAVLFTAVNEDWGIVPLEGMAYGKPVLSTNQGGPRESVLEGKTGFLLEPQAQQFASKMLLLSQKRALVRKMGKNARRRAQQYEWDDFVKDIDDMLESV